MLLLLIFSFRFRVQFFSFAVKVSWGPIVTFASIHRNRLISSSFVVVVVVFFSMCTCFSAIKSYGDFFMRHINFFHKHIMFTFKKSNIFQMLVVVAKVIVVLNEEKIANNTATAAPESRRFTLPRKLGLKSL